MAAQTDISKDPLAPAVDPNPDPERIPACLRLSFCRLPLINVDADNFEQPCLSTWGLFCPSPSFHNQESKVICHRVMLQGQQEATGLPDFIGWRHRLSILSGRPQCQDEWQQHDAARTSEFLVCIQDGASDRPQWCPSGHDPFGYFLRPVHSPWANLWRFSHRGYIQPTFGANLVEFSRLLTRRA